MLCLCHQWEVEYLFSHSFLRAAFSDSLIVYAFGRLLPLHDGCICARWVFILYFQMAGEVDGHSGQITGTFVHGEFMRSVNVAK